MATTPRRLTLGQCATKRRHQLHRLEGLVELTLEQLATPEHPGRLRPFTRALERALEAEAGDADARGLFAHEPLQLEELGETLGRLRELALEEEHAADHVEALRQRLDSGSTHRRRCTSSASEDGWTSVAILWARAAATLVDGRGSYLSPTIARLLAQCEERDKKMEIAETLRTSAVMATTTPTVMTTMTTTSWVLSQRFKALTRPLEVPMASGPLEPRTRVCSQRVSVPLRFLRCPHGPW